MSLKRCLHVLILRACEITVFGGKKNLKDVIKVRMLR